MEFKPCSEQEIARMKLWDRGEYPFEVIEGSDKTSKKSGKPMIELKLKLSNGKGAAKVVTDYLMPQMPEKLRNACRSTGMLDKYDTGNVSGRDFLGRKGRLKLGIEKDKNGQYPPKNVVKDYL